jgi:hypothetical protein
MKQYRRLLISLSAALAAQATLALPTARAAVDPAFNANDVVLFFRNPNGTTGTDQIVVFSIGSSWNVFRRAATPGDPTFGTVIPLGNINTILSTRYDADWTNISGTLLAGAVGQNGSLNAASESVSNGDFARTAYITSPRLGAGTYGQRNSGQRNVPADNSTGTVSAINGANSGLANTNLVTTNPAFLLDGSTTFDSQNPLTGGLNPTPSTAWTSISGGVLGYVSTNYYTYGTVSNVALGLDLYRVSPSTNGSTAWQNTNSITADYGGGADGFAYFLGTITLSANGDVNFVAKTNAATTPTITFTGSLTNFITVQGTASAAQTSSVSGTDLTANVTITPPTGYEVSTDGTNYGGGASLPPTGGTLAATTVHVRLAAATAAGLYSGNLAASSAGATTQNVAANGTVQTSYESWASSFGLSGTNALSTSDPDGDQIANNREFAFGSDPTIGSPALTTTAKTGNQVSVTFLRRADLTYAVQKRASLTSGSFATDPGISPTNVVPQGTVPPGYTKVAFSVTATNNQFFQLLATQP